MYCTGAYAASRSVRVADIGNHPARDGRDNASGIALDGNRMIWTWKLDLLFFHFGFPFLLVLSPSGTA